MRSVFLLSRSGCLAPALIILNLLFGWLIFKPLEWLVVGVVLVLLFILNSLTMVRQMSSPGSSRDSRVIDVEAEVIKEDKQKKITRI